MDAGASIDLAVPWWMSAEEATHREGKRLSIHCCAIERRDAVMDADIGGIPSYIVDAIRDKTAIVVDTV